MSRIAGSWLAVRLRLLVTVVCAVAGACVGWALLHPVWPLSVVQVIAVAALVAVGTGCNTPLRLGSQHSIAVTGTALLLALVLLPAAWAILVVATGVITGRLAIHRPVERAVYTAGKDTLGMAAVISVVSVADLPAGPVPAGEWSTLVLVLPVAAAVYAVVDEVGGSTAVAWATGTRWWEVFVRGLAMRTVGRGVDVLLAAGVAAAAWADSRALLVAPLGVLVVHLAHTRRLGQLQERQVWAELAAAADAVAQRATGGDLAVTLQEAAERALGLLAAADRVAIEVMDVVATADRSGRQPAAGGAPVELPLVTELDQRVPPAGTIRLWLRSPAEWSSAEQELLRYYAASVATAARACARQAAVAEQAAEAAHAACTDPHTGLPNRRGLQDRLVRALTRRPRGGHVALVLIDLDDFKLVNDTLGHAAGDELLGMVASRLEQAAGDALVARLGGDEFAVLLERVATPTLVTFSAQRLVQALSGPVQVNGGWVELSASAGLALADDDQHDPDDLLHQADVAMYRTKADPRQRPQRLEVYTRTGRAAGPGLVVAASPPTAAAPSAVTGLQVRYTPIVELVSGRVTGATAQPLWRHPGLGDLPPLDALRVAEHSGCAAQLVEGVLTQALQEAAAWHVSGHGLQVVVPISPRTLADPRLGEAVAAALTRAGVAPAALVLQLCLLHTIGHLDAAQQAIERVRQQAGVAVAACEVTTTAATTVAELAPDQLHVDLATAGDTRTARAAVVAAALGLGKRLHAQVVVDGIERDGDRSSMTRLGCTTGTGPMFGNCLPAQSLHSVLDRGWGGQTGMLAAPLPAPGHRVRGIRRGLIH